MIDYIREGEYDFTNIIKGLILVPTTATVSFLFVKRMNKERVLCMSVAFKTRTTALLFYQMRSVELA